MWTHGAPQGEIGKIKAPHLRDKLGAALEGSIHWRRSLWRAAMPLEMPYQGAQSHGEPSPKGRAATGGVGCTLKATAEHMGQPGTMSARLAPMAPKVMPNLGWDCPRHLAGAVVLRPFPPIHQRSSIRVKTPASLANGGSA
jgi:hypothetical protein